jgi:hypothetical protein
LSKSLPWFRLYSEAVDDAKLRLLAFEDRWHFVAILCCKASGLLDERDAELTRRKLQVKLGLDARELGEVARRLSEVGLIDVGTFQPIAWNERQFQSDSSTDRVRAYRERTKRTRNVSVTAQETDTDTDTEEKKKKAKSRGARFALTSLPSDWLNFCKTNRPDLNPTATFAKFGDYWTAVPGARGVKLDWFATWRNFVRTERAPLPNVPQQQEWHKTASGVKQKGAEFGLVPESFCWSDGRQDWQSFKAAVYQRAGVSA